MLPQNLTECKLARRGAVPVSGTGLLQRGAAWRPRNLRGAVTALLALFVLCRGGLCAADTLTPGFSGGTAAENQTSTLSAFTETLRRAGQADAALSFPGTL